jgi:hypothetical protein
MEAFIGGMILIEAVLISTLLALWITWLALRGLFWLMPGATRTAVAPSAQPIQVVPSTKQGNRQQRVAA